MATLYDMAGWLAEIMAAADAEAEASGGEISSDIADAIDRAEVDIGRKRESVIRAMLDYEARAEARRMEADRFRKAAASDEAAADRLHEYLAVTTPDTGAAAGPWEIKWRRSEAVEVTDFGAIPAEYIREKISREPDKAALKAALKAGPVAGAAIVERKNIMIK